MITMAEAMLQIKCSNGVGYNSPDQTEELSVTHLICEPKSRNLAQISKSSETQSQDDSNKRKTL